MKKVQLFLVFGLVLNLSDLSGNGLETDKEIYKGSFEVKLSEGMNKTIKGSAEFIHTIAAIDDEDDIGSTLTMTLTSDAGDGVITILVGDITDLDGINTGSYTVDLEPEEGDPVAMVGIVVNKTAGYIGSSGRVEITKIDNIVVVGTISATLMGDDEKTIALSGIFEAVVSTGNN